MCSSMELPYIFFIIFFFFINVYPELHKNLAMSDLLHAQTRTRLKRYQQAITHYCNLLIIRVPKKISLKCAAYFTSPSTYRKCRRANWGERVQKCEVDVYE